MALIKDGVSEKGFLSIDSESDTIYFNGNHLNGLLREFYECDIEITVKKLPKVIGKCPRMIELCDARDDNGNCLHTRLCVPIQEE